MINYQHQARIYKKKINRVIDIIEHELSHLNANDEETWNEEFYTNGKLDYRKLCIGLLEYIEKNLKEVK